MRIVTCLTLFALVGTSGTARAQAALDEGSEPKRTTDPAAAPDTLETGEPPVEYGATLRLRQVFVPRGMVELFVLRASGGSTNTGYGIELARRRGNLELHLGIEYEKIEVPEGVWINKGDNVAAGDEADYIISAERAGKSLGWLTFEFTFVNHAPIGKFLAIRYGAGAGIGVVTGGLQRYDVACVGATNDNPEPGCRPAQLGGSGVATGPTDYDLPPVFPVVTALLGLQIRPVSRVVINIEGGIRTIPFAGVSAGAFF